MRKAILEFIAIKLDKEQHKRFSKFMTKIAYLVFILILAAGLYNRINTYIDSSEILDKGHTTNIEIVLDEEYKGDKVTYYYNYSFEVNGKPVSGRFYASKSSQERWGKSATVEFRYISTEPEKARPLAVLNDNTSTGKLIKGFALLFVVGAIVVWITYALITAVLVIPRENT